MCCELDNVVLHGATRQKAFGTRPKWIVLADTDKMNKSVAIRHADIYEALCITSISHHIERICEQQMAQKNALAIPTGI